MFPLSRFRKIINDIPAHPDSNIMYARYLFIYHLWKKINNGIATAQNRITSIAVDSLGAPPDAFPPFAFENVLPEVPKDELNPAKYLLDKEFNIKKCREIFLQFYRKNKGGTWKEKNENATIIPSSSKKTASQVVRMFKYQFAAYLLIINIAFAYNYKIERK